MEISHPFQGVACHCFDHLSFEDSIVNKLLGLTLNPVSHHDITCYELKLSNKYYETTIHLFDHARLNTSKPQLDNDSILEKCQAIILYGNGQTLTTEQLDSKVNQLSLVEGEPRILLYHGIDEDCHSFKTLSEWSLKRGYDFIDTSDEEARNALIDSLSAYKWRHRLNTDSLNDHNTSGNSDQQEANLLNDDTMKKLMDFDSLLGKLSAYRDRPELRGNPDDKNIQEIAQILSGLLSDDGDAFLDDDDDDDDNDCNDEAGKNGGENGDSSKVEG